MNLPDGLDRSHVTAAIDYVEREALDLIDIYYEQANVFSAVIGILGIRALDSISPYKKHKHPDVAQQRFPDLSLNGRLRPPSKHSLESKGSIRPWALQSHYDHPGWYIVWRYLVDRTMTIKRGRPVVIWRVDVAYLEKKDWKYEKSSAGVGGGGRTHTFGVIKPASKLRAASIFEFPGVRLRGGRPVLHEPTKGIRPPRRR